MEDLQCWQATRAFKLEVYRLVRQSAGAQRDERFRHQLMDAAASGEANIAEGFRRFGARQFVHFLGYAVASIEEARRRLQDGVDRGYIEQDACDPVLAAGLSALRLTVALKTSLLPYAKR
ncbi:MAG: four helix bundle protein [Acidobacteria bacterium]|nr:four helix bundle protein [Acidobacteriota bacterium]